MPLVNTPQNRRLEIEAKRSALTDTARSPPRPSVGVQTSVRLVAVRACATYVRKVLCSLDWEDYMNVFRSWKILILFGNVDTTSTS